MTGLLPQVLQYLAQAKRGGRLPHGLLLLGAAPQKALLAALLARGLCCSTTNHTQDFGCGHCEQCRQINSDSSANLRWVAPAEESSEVSLGIEEIRAINWENNMRGFAGGPRIFVFPFSQHITTSAANAFLKTLEEPGEDRYVFMLAPSLYSVLPTISSRCQRVFCPTGNFIPVELGSDIQLPKFLISTTSSSTLKEKELIQNNLHGQIEAIGKFPTTRDEALGVTEEIASLFGEQLRSALIKQNRWTTQEYIKLTDAALATRQKIQSSANSLLAFEELLLR